MKPVPFAYVRAASLDQVGDLLTRHGEEARIQAGGQSLIPTLNVRLSAPALLVDIKDWRSSPAVRPRTGCGHVRPPRGSTLTGSGVGCTGRLRE